MPAAARSQPAAAGEQPSQPQNKVTIWMVSLAMYCCIFPSGLEITSIRMPCIRLFWKWGGVLDVQGKVLTQTMVQGRADSLAKLRISLYNDVSLSPRFLGWILSKVLVNAVRGKLEAGMRERGNAG